MTTQSPQAGARRTRAHHIDQPWRRAVEHAAEDAEGQAGDADKANLALLLQRLQRGQRLLENHLYFHKLYVVALHDVDVADA